MNTPSVWRPCVSARPCESCREPISPGAWVYHGEVVRLYWCESCALKRIGRTPGASEIPTAYLAPKPAKAALREVAEADEVKPGLFVAKKSTSIFAPGGAMTKLTDAAPRDWAKAAAGDDE